MADRKYSDDSVLTTLADTDKINVLDVSDPADGAGGTSKQITYGSLKTLIAAIHPNVTLTGSYDYLTISGQVITLNAIDLAADVTGALPIANGGTGQTTAQAAFEALAANGGEIGAGISVIGSSDEVQAAFRANASQTANVFVVEDSGGTDRFYVDSAYRLYTNNVLRLNTNNSGVQGKNTSGSFVNIIRINGSNEIAIYNDLHLFKPTGLAITGTLEITSGFGMAGVTPQAQQAHIVDADGSLADITTKFNTLLADLEGFGFLATS